jgi:hypothetical protein
MIDDARALTDNPLAHPVQCLQPARQRLLNPLGITTDPMMLGSLGHALARAPAAWRQAHLREL